MKRLIFFSAKKQEAIQLPLSLDIQHFYKSSDSTLVDGLVSNVTDSGLDANADFSQAVAINQPSIGYDKVGNYVADAANLTFDGSNLVSSWANNETNSRALGALTPPTAGAKPLWNSGEECVDFASGKYVTLSNTARTVSAFTLCTYIKIPFASDSVILNNVLKFFRISSSSTPSYSGIEFQIVRKASNVFNFAAIIVNSGLTFSRELNYTAAQLNALMYNDYAFLTMRFLNGELSIYVNSTLVTSGVSSTVTSVILPTSTPAAIQNLWGVDSLKVKQVGFFFSALSASEINLLYTNRNNPTYELPRQGIVSTGNSFMRNTLVLNQNNEITVGGYVYFPSLVSGTFTEILISTDTVNKGFQLKIIRSGSNLYFNFTCWNGATAMEANSAAITLTNFNSLYANKFSQIAGTFYFGKVSVLVQQAALGSATYAPTQFEQSADGIVTLMGVNNAASLSAGIRVEGVFITEKALSATHLLLRKENDVINLPHVA